MVGVLTTAAATVIHVRTVRRLNSGEPFVGRPTWVGILVAVLLAAIGTLMSRVPAPRLTAAGNRRRESLPTNDLNYCSGGAVASSVTS